MKAYFLLFSLLCLSSIASATSIYKCTNAGGEVMFTDTPCPNMAMQVVHQETEAEANERVFKAKLDKINDLIQDNQIAAAQVYAASEGLSGFYEKALSAHKIALEFKRQQEALAAQQQQRELEQQRLALQQRALQLQAQQLQQQRQEAAVSQSLMQPQNSVYHYITPLLARPCTWPQHCWSYSPYSVSPPRVPMLPTSQPAVPNTAGVAVAARLPPPRR